VEDSVPQSLPGKLLSIPDASSLPDGLLPKREQRKIVNDPVKFKLASRPAGILRSITTESGTIGFGHREARCVLE